MYELSNFTSLWNLKNSLQQNYILARVRKELIIDLKLNLKNLKVNLLIKLIN